MIPAFGGLPLLSEDGSLCSGAAFGIHTAPHEDTLLSVGSWELEMKRGLAVVVARGGTDTSPDRAVSSALFQAQQGLDLLSAKAAENLGIMRSHEDLLIWWPEETGLVIRVVVVDPLFMGISPVSATVIRPNGSLVADPPEPPVAWHESFRYFRLSQTTDDLFDAFRNAYLALESVLSSIAPQKTDPSGKVDEGEGQWFRRALGQADRIVPLAGLVPQGTADPLQSLFQQLYIDTRGALSHAKSGRRVLLPQNEKEREQVAMGLATVVRLYLGLAKAHLGLRRLGGGFTQEGFSAGTGSVLDAVKVFASDDETPFSPSEAVLNPAGGQLVELHADPVDTARPFLVTKLAKAPTPELGSLPFIRRVVSSTSEGQPLQAAVMEARLSLGSSARFEVLLGVRGVNRHQPRTRYLS